MSRSCFCPSCKSSYASETNRRKNNRKNYLVSLPRQSIPSWANYWEKDTNSKTVGVITLSIKDYLNEEQKVGIEDFEFLRLLGTGSYGRVFLVRKLCGKDSQKLYAMKVLCKATIVQKNSNLGRAKTEQKILQIIRDGPFLMNLHYAFQTDAKLHFVLDYINGGDLFTHFQNVSLFIEDHARFYIAEVILALEHLHKNGIIYRDLKPENILLNSEGHIVLTDFGLSKLFLPDEKDCRAYSFCGTTEYMAPEVIEKNNGYNYAADIWSVGVLLFEVLIGAPPFTAKKRNKHRILKKILKKKLHLPDSLSHEAKNFLQMVLVKDPRKRLGNRHGIVELKKHTFFNCLNWEDLAEKKIAPPFRPTITNPLDTTNFSEEFTSQSPCYSPGITPPNCETLFKGFSYVSPSIICSENTNYTPKQKDSTICSVDKLPDSPFYKKYAEKDILGVGSFSVCRVCVDHKTKVEYAVKMTKMSSMEVKHLQVCQGHPNIVKLHEVIHDKNYTYIILELLKGGELLQRIKQKTHFTEKEAQRIFCNIASAVNFMHKRNVVHRDLKPENLMFVDSSDNAVIKIVDFGFAQIKPSQKQQLLSPCFTMHYAAPEVLNVALPNSTNDRRFGRDSGYNEACDLWSLGIILYVMLSGETPYQTYSKEVSVEAMMKSICEEGFSFHGKQWDVVSEEAKDIIRGLLIIDPQERFTMHQLQAQDWVRGYHKDLIANNLLSTPHILNSIPPMTTKTSVNFQMSFSQEPTAQVFCLQDVSSTPLAQRRKKKKTFSNKSSSSPSSGGISSCQTIDPWLSSSGKENSPKPSKNELLVFDVSNDKVNKYLSTQIVSEKTMPFTNTVAAPLLAMETNIEDLKKRSATLFKKRKYDNI